MFSVISKGRGFGRVCIALLITIVFFAIFLFSRNQAFAASEWSVVPSPNGSTTRDNMIKDIVAVSWNNVWAVGYYGDNLNNAYTLIEQWDGKNWNVASSSGLLNSILNGIAAVSADNIWAVGSYGLYPRRTLIEHWDGIKWSIADSPNPPGSTVSYLTKIVAVSADNIWAVGTDESSKSSFLLHYDGISWKIVIYSSTREMFNTITARASNDVWIAGSSYANNLARSVPLFKHWDGSSWTIVSSPSISGYIYGITAISANDVWAAGFAHSLSYSVGSVGPLLMHYDGTSWRVVVGPPDSFPDEIITGGGIYDISAFSSNDIWAVGSTIDFLHYNGTSWDVVSGPVLGEGGYNSGTLYAVDAISANDVWAAGTRYSSTGRKTLIEHYSSSEAGNVLNVQLMKQGIYPFTDNNPVWEGEEYDNANSQFTWCGKSIASCGCATSSIAMLLNYYGVKNPSDGSDTTPASVNNYFKLDKKHAVCGKDSNNNPIFGWRTRGYSCADVVWKAASEYSKDSYDANKSTVKIDMVDGWPIDYNAVTLTDDINLGNPDILWSVDKSHYFVGKGILGNTFLINDPFFDRVQLDDPAYGNNASQMVRYEKVNSDFSAIIVPVVAPDQVLITDSYGRRTGFDPITSSVVREIPNSSYYFQASLRDDTGQNATPPSGSGQYWASIGTPEAGLYKIQVISAMGGLYSFGAYSYNKDSHLTLNNYSGQVVTGIVPTYSFFYIPTANESYIGQVIIDVKPEGNSDVINPKSNGVLRVGILSEDTFDPVTVDPLSVKFGQSGASPNKNQTKDVNEDKKIDRIFYFPTEKTEIKSGDTEACLTGKTFDGLAIKGCVSINIVP